ncbi:MAG TPA: hypothetical protein VHO50_04765 [Bacteroidales bacterium]|nr:hypothetical protein [Bacteroidales bacterium]
MLISNYNDTGSASASNQEKWDSEISVIHKTIISLNELIDIFYDKISSAVDELTTDKDKVFELFNELSSETHRNIDSVTLKNHEANLHFPVLKEKTIETTRKISDIITHLQYHDIIRQKIEHIQKSHYRIIDDLNLAGDNSRDNCSHDDYIKVGDIIDLQAAQLLLVSKEYQNALNVITRNFQGIAKDMKTVSEISDRFSFDSNETENTLLSQIRKQLDKGIIDLDQNNNGLDGTGFFKLLKELGEILGRIEKNIISNLAGFIGSNGVTNWFKFNEAASGVYSQMVVLNKDIDLKCQGIVENITELKNLSDEIMNMGSSDVETNQFEIERLQLMVRITRILDMLDKGNEELDMVLKQNREMNNNILQKLEHVISKNDYCKYFEMIVGEIILKLTGINTRIRPSSPGSKKSENLKDMMGSYTMESERIIHNMVIKGDEDTEEEDTEEESNEDVEFF